MKTEKETIERLNKMINFYNKHSLKSVDYWLYDMKKILTKRQIFLIKFISVKEFLIRYTFGYISNKLFWRNNIKKE